MALTVIIMGTTARSCAISTPTAIRPVRRRNSPRLSMTFTATAVDESAIANPNRIAAGTDQPSNCAAINMTPTLAPICTNVVTKARTQTRRNARNDNSMPIRNSSMRTPSSAKLSMPVRSCTKPRPDGPSNTPARIYPTMAGWRRRSRITPQANAATATAAIPVRASWTCPSI